jgi:7-cyano-7-deazaguanine synthase in queuosine biosynthesis
MHDGAVDVRISDGRIARGFKGALSPRICDLLDIAGAVYRCDRMEPRRSARRRTYAASHQRALSVAVGVRDLDFWRQGGVDVEMRGALDWLTGDRWQLEYVPFAGARTTAETDQQLLSGMLDADGQISLFSGGLDALAGAAVLLEDDPRCALLAVGSNPRQIRCQFRLMRELRELVPGLTAIPASAGLSGATGQAQERSQRSRAFLFLSIAIAAAHAGGAATINMCENGIGAMNLPYSDRQLGVDTSRAAHPETLRRMQSLAVAVLERPIAIRNPLFGFTKAEACRLLPREWLPLVAQTVSCDIGFTDRRSGPQLCGVCSSCLLRRHALHAAGLGNIDRAQPYKIDVLREPARVQVFRAMETQASRLAAAFTNWPDLLAAFPDLQRVKVGLLASGTAVDERQAEATITRLVAAYVNEWRYFPARVSDSHPEAVETVVPKAEAV